MWEGKCGKVQNKDGHHDIPDRTGTIFFCSTPVKWSKVRMPGLFLGLRELSFFTGRGGCLLVMAGRQFFLVPTFAYA